MIHKASAFSLLLVLAPACEVSAAPFVIIQDDSANFEATKAVKGASASAIQHWKENRKKGDIVEIDVQGLSKFQGQLATKNIVSSGMTGAMKIEQILSKNPGFTGFSGHRLRRTFAQQDGAKLVERFERTIGGKRVYRGDVVSVTDADNMYEFYGSPMEVSSASSCVLTRKQALEAVAQAIPGAKLVRLEEVLFNPYLLDKSSVNETNAAWEFVGDVDGMRVEAILDGSTGKLLFKDDGIRFVLSRTIYDQVSPQTWNWGTGPNWTRPTAARSEGGAASSVAVVNSAYDFSKTWYDFFNTNFGRDSYNGSGGGMFTFARIKEWKETATGPTLQCATSPNAFAYQSPPGDRYVAFCPNYLVNDIFYHEFSHQVVDFTANYTIGDYKTQGAGLHEGTADIFAALITQDWRIGEGITSNPRNLANPTADGKSIDNFSKFTGQDGHYTSGIIGKAAYLFTMGGTGLNSTAITGQGYTKSANVMYQSLIRLQANSGFQDWGKMLVDVATSSYGRGANSPGCNAAKATDAVGLATGKNTFACSATKVAGDLLLVP